MKTNEIESNKTVTKIKKYLCFVFMRKIGINILKIILYPLKRRLAIVYHISAIIYYY